MFTHNLHMPAAQSSATDSGAGYPPELQQLFAQMDAQFLNAGPSRYDRLYIDGNCRKQGKFTEAYYAEKKCTQWELSGIGNLKPMMNRALLPTEINSNLSWWGRVITGERPLAYSKVDSLFAAELHVLLVIPEIGAQWFADSHSDGCYHLVLFRKDYPHGKSMAGQLIELLKKRESEAEKNLHGLRKAIFLLRYHHHKPFGEQELLSFNCTHYLTPNESHKRKLCDALQGWLDNGVLRQHYSPPHIYGAQQGIARERFEACTESNGLSDWGAELMARYWEKMMFDPLPVGDCSLEQALDNWQRLSLEERRGQTLARFARSRNISSQVFNIYASVAGGLKPRGAQVLARWHSYTLRPEIKKRVLTHSAVMCWLQIGREQREKLTTVAYAILTGADIRCMQSYICKEGLTRIGRDYFKKGRLSTAMLRKWASFSDQQRQMATLAGYANSHHISPSLWGHYATLAGLTPAGENEMQYPGPDALLQKVTAILNNPSALTQLLAQGTDLSRQKQATRYPRPAIQAAAGCHAAESVIKQVKQEPAAGDEECSWEPRIRLHQPWNDAAPLLTSAANPHISLTRQLLKVRPLRFTFSEPLNRLLERVSRPRYQRFIREIQSFASAVVDSDGGNQPAWMARYLAAPVQQFVDCAQHPQQQTPAAEGLKIIAACDIPALTPVGAYSGVLLENQSDQSIEYALIGAERSLGGSWTLPASGEGPARVVSSFRNANRLALVNTNQLPGLPPLNEVGKAGEQGNNLAVMFINDLVPVYVSIRAIKSGQQLLISYSGLFNPLEIKQESYRTDTLSLVARRFNVAVIIENVSGELESGWNRSGEEVGSNGSEQLLQPAIILRQRECGDDYIWYDAINAQGEIITHSPEHPYDNFWHALACALFTEATPENMAQLKAMVAEQD